MKIKTDDFKSIKHFSSQVLLPQKFSHKGNNGKLLIIGGSSLFHSSPIWAAEIASHVVDIVHLSSVKENEKVFENLKSNFLNGIVVRQEEMINYLKEDDCVLVGPGMVRGEVKEKLGNKLSLNKLLKLSDEPSYTYYLLRFLVDDFNNKRYVFDAGALQMMEVNDLLKLREKPILTPHQKEFEKLFGLKVSDSLKKRIEIVKGLSKKYNSVICLKGRYDVISNGSDVIVIEGGNAGLTKGGTGDLLAGLIAALYTKNSPLVSAVVASFLIKLSADNLFKKYSYWYNIDNLLAEIPKVMKEVLF